jgi:predicted aldo/keto reductase-like oxidoreductase
MTLKNFGFGCMRLPMADGEIDLTHFTAMVDRFLEAGFTYFDTAHGYMDGKSETVLRDSLVRRHPRDSYILTDKMTAPYFETESDLPGLFADQLEKTGTTYFDYYLMHSLTEENYDKFQRCNTFAFASRLKAEGKIRHLGISFHDSAELLDRILTDHPEVEVVQIQFNYIDDDNPTIQGRRNYEVCRRHGKQVIIMEPCKGGGLTNLPENAQKLVDALGVSAANLAIRYTASLPGVFMVLSGMSSLAQMEENIGFMTDCKPLNEQERSVVSQVREILKKRDLIACTACRYCVDGCPQRIPIPDLFACFNAKKQYLDWNSNFYYSVTTNGRGKASDCVECGRCEEECPQHLPIRALLKDVATALEE